MLGPTRTRCAGVVEGGDKRGTPDRVPDRQHPRPEGHGLARRRRVRRLVHVARTAIVHPCAINIGRRPTFYEHAEQSLLEAHLIDFEGDLYGEQVGGVVRRLPAQRAQVQPVSISWSSSSKIDVDDAQTLLAESEWQPLDLIRGGGLPKHIRDVGRNWFHVHRSG